MWLAWFAALYKKASYTANVVFRNEKAGVILDGKFYNETKSLQNIPFSHIVKQLVQSN